MFSAGGTGVLLVVLSLPAYIPFLLLGYTVGILATLAFVIVLFSRTGFVWPLVALVGSVLVVCLGTGLK